MGNKKKKFILRAFIFTVVIGVTLSSLYFVANNNYLISNDKKSYYQKDKKDVRKYSYWDHFRINWGDLIF